MVALLDLLKREKFGLTREEKVAGEKLKQNAAAGVEVGASKIVSYYEVFGEESRIRR